MKIKACYLNLVCIIHLTYLSNLKIQENLECLSWYVSAFYNNMPTIAGRVEVNAMRPAPPPPPPVCAPFSESVTKDNTQCTQYS